MRILHVLEPADGGVATHVRGLIGEQVRRGHDVQAVVPARGPLAADLRALGAGVATLDLRPELWAPGADLRAARALAALLRDGGWDVVHTHESKAGVLVRPLARAFGLPLVHAPHTYAYLTQEARGRGGARRTLTLGVERALARFSDVVVLPSDHLRERAVADGAVPAARAVTAHNGSDPAPAAKAHPAIAALEPPVVGYLGRMTEEKDPLALVDALLRVDGISAALVGDGPLAAAVAERAAALGDRAVVLPYEGAGPALAGFDLVASAARFETFGIGLLEAMGAGLPVVATRVGGVPEVVQDGVTGILVEPGDTAALAAAIGRLAGDADLRRRMGEAGRERARRFSVAALADAIDAAYARAGARARPRRRAAGSPPRSQS